MTAEYGAMLMEGNRVWLLILIATFIFNFTLIYRGITKGIETFFTPRN